MTMVYLAKEMMISMFSVCIVCQASVMSDEFDQECHRACSKAKSKIRETIWGERGSQRR